MKKRESITILLLLILTIVGILLYTNSNLGLPNVLSVDDTITPMVTIRLTPQSTLTPTPTPYDAYSWTSYTWNTINFSFPNTWQVQENTYQTPAMLDVGASPEVVGLTVFSGTSPLPETSIMLGGRQVSCETFEYEVLCSTYEGVPVYTTSENPDVLFIYNQILASLNTQLEPTPEETPSE